MAGRKHLTFEQRKKIESMNAHHKRPKEIADTIGVSISTIYNELRRGKVDGTYSAQESQLRYQRHLTDKGPDPLVLKNPKLRDWIHARLMEGMNPHEVEEELKQLNDPELGHVSHQTIATAIQMGYIPDIYPERSRSQYATLQRDGTVYIPQWFLRTHGLSRGQRFEVSMKNGSVILKPTKKDEGKKK